MSLPGGIEGVGTNPEGVSQTSPGQSPGNLDVVPDGALKGGIHSAVGTSRWFAPSGLGLIYPQTQGDALG